MKFSLVSTVFNEASRIRESIQDLENQSLLPDEIIITDAGSTDGTLEILNEWSRTSSMSITIISAVGCNVAKGRNISIKHSRYDIIVSTDFGCRFHQAWLKNLVSPFSSNEVYVVGGFFTVLEENIQTKSARANYVLSNGYQCVNNKYFIPSSRSIAYRKAVWMSVGGYPEWLTLAADDLLFGTALQLKGYDFYIVEEANVYWDRHTTRKGYLKEAGRYGLGDGEAKLNRSNTAKKLLRTCSRCLSLVFAILTPLEGMFIVLALANGIIGFQPYISLFNQWNKYRSSKYNLSVFIESLMIFEGSIWYYLFAYIKGYFSKNKDRIVGVHRFRENNTLC